MGFSGPVSMENAFKIANNKHTKNYFLEKWPSGVSSFIFQVHISLTTLFS